MVSPAFYPSPSKTTLVGEGEGWLAWVREATGERVIGVEDQGLFRIVTLGQADHLRRKAPNREADISTAEQAFN